MNTKQQTFVNNYLIDMNATKAAKLAGYSEKTAYSIGQRLLKNVEVAAAIAKAQSVTAKKLEITKDELIEDLMIIRDAQRIGTPAGASAAIKALEVVIKMLGYNSPDKIEHSGELGLDINITINKPNEKTD